MKNKFKSHNISFRILVFVLSFLIQSCTEYGENHKVVAQECCDIAKTLSIKRYSSGDEDNIFSNGEFKQFREFRSSVQKDFKLITSTAFDHVTEHAFSDLLKEGAIFTAASSLGPVGLTMYGASKVVDFALSFPALKDQIENIIENYGDIPHETKIETGTKLACDFIIGSLLKCGNKINLDDPSKLQLAKNLEKRLPDTPIRHHLVSNKHFSNFTPKYEAILNKYGKKLNEEWNLIKVPYKYHYSKHPEKYHEFVLKELKNIDKIAQGNKELFLELFNKEIRDKVLANPSMLNKTGW